MPWCTFVLPSRMAHTYSAPALEKGLDILECLAEVPQGLTQAQMASTLGRSIGEIFRMLDVLERRGYLARSSVDSRYRLTLKLMDLAHRQPRVKRLATVALPLMNELADRTRQSNHLVVHHDHRILVVAQVDSPEAMGFSVRLGAHFPFRIDRVSARTLVAFQSPARQDVLVQELIANDPQSPSPRSIRARITSIRKRGHEELESDTLPGLIDLCFPILDATGQAIATLTQPWMKHRYNQVTLAQARAIHAEIAARISADMGALDR